MTDRTSIIIDKLLKGDKLSAAKIISMIENESPDTQNIVRELYPHTGNAHIIGVTGAPGVGKSTLVDKLISEFRKRKHKVGVIAVDPTSPFTGGALLGDRIRMCDHSLDDGVFIRSMGSRGHTGGIAGATSDAVKVLDAFGMDIIIIETIGAGQSEVAVADIGDTMIVVTSPGLGDDIQFLKAGILEIGDIFVVNKSDLDGADQTVADLEMMLSTKESEGKNSWKIQVIKAIATRSTDKGIVQVVESIMKHMKYLHSSGIFEIAREEKCKKELVTIAQMKLTQHITCELKQDSVYDSTVKKMLSRKLDPYTAADLVLKHCGLQKNV